MKTGRPPKTQAPDPTPEEIARLCKVIQLDWTPHDYAIRAGKTNPWFMPEVKSPEGMKAD